MAQFRAIITVSHPNFLLGDAFIRKNSGERNLIHKHLHHSKLTTNQ